MSEKKDIVSNQAEMEEKEDNDLNEASEAKKDLIKVDPNFEKSELFLRQANSLFESIFSVFQENQDSMFEDEIDLYSAFLPKFQAGKLHQWQPLDGKVVKQKLANLFLSKQCPVFSTITDKNHINYKNDKLVLSGLLYLTLQNKLGPSKSNLFQPTEIIEVKDSEFPISNVYLATANGISYEEYKNKPPASRIIFHLGITPNEFWNSKILEQVVNVALSNEHVYAVKIRNFKYFGLADSLLLYITESPQKVWKQLGKQLLSAIPTSARSSYKLPFSLPIDLGVNANAALYITEEKSVKRFSFTGGLAFLARQALIWCCNKYDDTHGTDLEEIELTREIQQELLASFPGNLAKAFKLNHLYMAEDGSLIQASKPK